MRLIDVDAINDFYIDFSSYQEGPDDDDVRAWLDEQPTIEAEPVRRGEWALLFGTYGPMVCSECGGEAPNILMGSEYEESQYCPTCGAKMKMDGGEKE